ncbi:MAG: sodium:proton antiporter NhaD [Pseudomonadota bacterium]
MISVARLRPTARWPFLVAIGIAVIVVGNLVWTAVVAPVVPSSLLTDPRSLSCLLIFVLAYALVMTEERTGLRKSKPVILAAGLTWMLVAWAAPTYGIERHEVREAVFHDLDEYGALALFLLAAMTYIAALDRLNVFVALRERLVRSRLSYRGVFWATGFLAFCLSAVADNLTTALVMGAVVATVGIGQTRFIALGLVNIVCASNTGGAFSPFGDLTTLMVWQAGKLDFFAFFALVGPSLVAYLIPALLMSRHIANGCPLVESQGARLHRGAKRAILLGVLTISLAVTFEQVLELPAFLGMMTGLSLLMTHFYQLRLSRQPDEPSFDIFEAVAEVEWDTLLFFYGIMFCVGGLAFIGYLELMAGTLYGGLGPTVTHILLGVISAVIDNIPVMFAVLTMDPVLSDHQWLLITFTTGVGGSLLAIGSAAGVALLAVGHGHYTFSSHLRWTPAIAAGFAAGIACHLLVNG